MKKIYYSEKTRSALFVLALAAITLAGGYYIYACVKYAPWGFSDSTTYLASARNLASGAGLGVFNADGSFSPLQIFAPLYPAFLSLFASGDLDLVSTAGVLDILLFMTLIGANGWLFLRSSQSKIGALCFAGLITFTPALINAYTSIMSEPLAITLGTTGFLLLLSSLSQTSPHKMVLSAILIGLSMLTRYAFVSYALAGFLSILLLLDAPLKKRLKRGLVFSLLSLLPLAVWLLIQLFFTRSVGARHYSLDFSLLEKISQFFGMMIDVLKYWLPYRTNLIPGLSAEVFRPFLFILLASSVLITAFLLIKKRKKTIQEKYRWGILAGLTLLFVAYTLMLLVTFSVSRELISVDERMLSPLIPILYGILLVGSLVIDQSFLPKFSLPVITLLIVLLFVLFNYRFMRTHPSEIGIFPNGYTSSIWKENPLLNGEINVPEGRPLISNAPDIVLFYLNRPAYYLSSDGNAEDMELSIHDERRIQSMLQEECAVLLLFDPNSAQRYEQLPNPISDADLEKVVTRYTPVYSGEGSSMILEETCPTDAPGY